MQAFLVSICIISVVYIFAAAAYYWGFHRRMSL